MLDAWYGALAVELKDGAQPRPLLERPPAAALAGALSAELSRHLSGLEGLGLCWMAACYDVAQLLRPGFPVHAELRQMYQAGVRDPLAQPQVMTLSALREQAPSVVLQPEAALGGGSLVYLPLVLLAQPERLAPIRETLEARLLEEGLLDARSARILIDALQAPIEHARLLSCDDLCAITAANLEHAGLPSVWQVIETALFRPDANIDVHGLDALRWSVIGGVAHLHLSLFDYRLQAAAQDDASQMLAQLRQALALLKAHAVPWRILPSSAGASTVIEQDEAGFWIEWREARAPIAEVTHVQDAQGALLWLELHDDKHGLRACALPLDPVGFQALRQRLKPDDGRPLGQSTRRLSSGS